MTMKLSDTARATVFEQLLEDHCYLSDDQPSVVRGRWGRQWLRPPRRAHAPGQARKCRSVLTLCIDYGAVFLFFSAFNMLSQTTIDDLDQSAQLLLLSTLLTGLFWGCIAAQLHVWCRRFS